jgi:UDP-N-acetylmuramoyl-tripeptide--D-alanyl-D-alanine ligase
VTALWTQAELSAALDAPPNAPLGASVTGVSIDSRTLEAGDLFFAIRGDAHDGHDHVARAFEADAAAAVVSRERARELAALGPAFVVEDTLKAMERLGVAARARSKAKIVAVTGSVGKTTAKEMLRTMLAACGATHASAASYNNHWGVPLTLARMPANVCFGVFEMGMNHAGEITPLTRMARPHVVLVTTIAPVHIEHLGSLEAIADAKAEIFLGLEPQGTAVLNRDAPQFERLKKAAAARGARVLSFGRGVDCDAQLIEVEAIDGGSRVRARVLAHELPFELGAPGDHMAQDALGALLAAEALGADLEACAAALRRFSP